ncbi:MAG: polyprenyl synthetase family protein [bacterium]
MEIEQETIKSVPADPFTRELIRRIAKEELSARKDASPLSFDELADMSEAILKKLQLSSEFTGFTMVALHNAFWHDAFVRIPFDRRVLLLPHCLRNSSVCIGTYDSEGLNCGGCGSCDISALRAQAMALGYQVVIAEGTSAVLMKIMSGEADAVFGTACLDSLEKSHQRIRETGIPNIAVPLLNDGCINTTIDIDELNTLLTKYNDDEGAPSLTYLPLLRRTHSIFTTEEFSQLLPDINATENFTVNEGVKWVLQDGKRLRPFITIAAYATMQFEEKALNPEITIPTAVKKLAIAIEILHKASLIHDDIEDGDIKRGKNQTLHNLFGVGPAVNIGDYLIGYGYNLIIQCRGTLGADCVTDILAELTKAHLSLCRGQGAELAGTSSNLLPGEVLKIYAGKSSPAFFAAVYTGARAATADLPMECLHRFCLYLGEAFQLHDDMSEWQDMKNTTALARELQISKPTILTAFALENEHARSKMDLIKNEEDPVKAVTLARELYDESGAFKKAKALRKKLREEALNTAENCPHRQLGDFLAFIARLAVPE